MDTADCFQFNGVKFNLQLTEPSTGHALSVDWIRKQKMIQRRYKHRSLVLGQTIFHIGGYVDGNSEGSIERWIYDNLREMFEGNQTPLGSLVSKDPFQTSLKRFLFHGQNW